MIRKPNCRGLLKRAATPLPVRLVSDNLTNVAIFKMGQFGAVQQLRTGSATGLLRCCWCIRAGYRDVRIEFYVAPEVDMEPVVVICEEQI